MNASATTAVRSRTPLSIILLAGILLASPPGPLHAFQNQQLGRTRQSIQHSRSVLTIQQYDQQSLMTGLRTVARPASSSTCIISTRCLPRIHLTHSSTEPSSTARCCQLSTALFLASGASEFSSDKDDSSSSSSKSSTRNNVPEKESNNNKQIQFLFRAVQKLVMTWQLRFRRGRRSVLQRSRQVMRRPMSLLIMIMFVVSITAASFSFQQSTSKRLASQSEWTTTNPTTTTTTWLARQGRGSPRNAPVEVTYGAFLDLLEMQKSVATGTAESVNSISPVPIMMDQVRIGNDRITFRLQPATNLQPKQNSKTSSITTTTTSTAISNHVEEMNQGKSVSSRSSQLHPSTQQQQQQRPSVRAYTRKVLASSELIAALRQNQIDFSAAATSSNTASTVRTILSTVVGAFYCLFLFRIFRTFSDAASGGSGSSRDTPGKLANPFQKKSKKKNRGKASSVDEDDIPLTNFDDIQGIDEAKLEVMELVDTIRHPEKYAILGARAPTGLLLEGPPGTGKTMLARATAATAGIPLLYCSGSDFVEMYVGRGAARVRRLFERAAKLAPCIIFIDELDALGKARDFGLGGLGGLGGPGGGGGRSNDEAEQTLNQLLACMDGLDSSRRICVLAATNRKDVLDPALVRPGRFDRLVSLKLPDAAGREHILRVHCRKLPDFIEGLGVDPDRPGSLGHGRSVDLSAIAAITGGLSGAELEVIVNEAAIRAVRRVSAALLQTPAGRSTANIIPHVLASDFEQAIRNFYETRKPKSMAVQELWKNVFK